MNAGKNNGPSRPLSWEPYRGSSRLDDVMRTREVSHTADAAAERVTGLAARFGGARSTIAVPMLKNDVLIGAMIIYRQEVRPFTDKQIALLQNFAAQAVIAIENTRLINELHQRTADLTESLEQQTATADVLRVISSTPGELTPVFETMFLGLIERWPSVQSVRLASQSSRPARQALAMFEPFRPKAVGHWVELLVQGVDTGRALPIFVPGVHAEFPSQAAG
jgi:hypothetical protein